MKVITPKESGVDIINSDGEVVDHVEYGTGGVKGISGVPVYKGADGEWTTDPLKTAKYTLTDDGAIRLTAPKALFETPEFAKIFDEDTLKSYSAAYRTDPTYRVPYTQLNSDGTTEETQLTIPEFVDKLNEALGNFVDNYRVAKKNQQKLVAKYGEKANNLSLTQLATIQNSGADSSRILLPEFIFDFSDDFATLRDKMSEDGSVSAEDFMSVYNRNRFSQEDLAEIMAVIDGYENASEWGEDTITLEDGTVIKNRNSASEAVKGLALKNFILSKDPDAEWYQSVGDGLWTLTANAAKGFVSVFMNTATMAEGAVSFGQLHAIEDTTEQLDEAFSNWNEERMLIQDSTAVLATLGQIGGMIGGTIAETALLKKVGGKISGAFETKVGNAATEALLAADDEAAVESLLASAEKGLTFNEALASLVGSLDDISRGAQFVMRVLPLAEKINTARNIYQAYMNAHSVLNWSTSLLLDTVHDAIVYDAVTLRHVIEGSSDQNMKNYWSNQLADNAKWWVGTGFARTTFKLAGQTPLGQAVNAKASQKIAGLSATVGDMRKHIRDSIYGGDVIKHLDDQIASMKDGPKKDRLINKINQERENLALREARRDLSKLDLEFEGLRLSDESAEEYRKAVTRIRNIELAIDRYGQDLSFKRQEIVGETVDPSTGRKIYVNPELGGANAKAGRAYDLLANLTTKYKLKDIDDFGISQSVVDYVMGSYDLKRTTLIANAKGAKSLLAEEDAKVIAENLASLRIKLPEELITELDNSDVISTYANFYYELNAYGKAKGLVDAETITSYEENPIWKEAGYVPVFKDNGRVNWESDSPTYEALVQRDIENLQFNTKPEQHYQNPELTRQYRINDIARAEVNQELGKALLASEDTTSVIKITGEETQRAKNFQKNKKALDSAIDDYGNHAAESMLIPSEKLEKVPKVGNKYYELGERTAAISTFSLSDTTTILQNRHILRSGNKRLSNLVTEADYDSWYLVQTKPVVNYLSQVYGDQPNTFKTFQKMAQEGGDDFEAGLQRAYLIGDENFAKSPILNRAIKNIENGNTAFYEGFAKEEAKSKLGTLGKVDTEQFVDDAERKIKMAVDDYVSSVLNDKGAMTAIEAIANDSGNGAVLTGKYIALQKLIKNKKAKETLLKRVRESLADKRLTYKQMEKAESATESLWTNYIRSELDTTFSALKTTNREIVFGLTADQNVYKEVQSLVNEIEEADRAVKTGGDTIMFLDSEGRQVYAEVDPNYASLYNLRYKMSRSEASSLAKVNAAMSKLFRYGTTTLNFSSFSNQLFRDTGNALIMGGAWETIKHNADNLVEVFGDDIVDQIKRFDPTGYEMRQVKAISEQTGQSLQEAAVSRELTRGAAVSPATTETTLYKQVMEQVNGGQTSPQMLDNAKNQIDNIVEKFDKVDDLMNGRRETYLRNRVYANNLSRALKQGYTLEQARSYANFAMNNATTNFTRQLYHLQAIGDSTPYFKAAINGTKSFWRMWSLDPVGVSGRMMGGLILPTIFLTGASLGDPDNYELYKNIPEYQKDENLIFVVDKQVITIPIPQEIANIVSPFRQFVETLYGADQNSFWELMMNDVLGFSPIDLTAFSTVDMDKMTQDPTIKDRVSRGFARVFSQVAPVPIKSGYMLVTGTDPYTGKNLYDPSYSYWDDATNSVQTMDYNQNAFAKWVASIWGNESSPAVLEKVVSGLFGSTGSNALGELTTLLEKGPEAGLSVLGADLTEQITKPYSAEVYNQADSVWKRAVRALTAEKEQLTSSKEFQAVYSELAQATDEDKRKKLNATGQDLINEYQSKVINTVKRLESVYQGTYDRKKFAATIQLLNFNSDAVYQSGTRYSSDIASEMFYSGRDTAISTMQALGVTGTNDLSIFGYLTTNNEGKSVMKYSSPTAIMDMKNAWYGAADIDQANIEAKLKTDGIKTSDMWDGYYAAKAQGKAALKQYKSEWNAKVVKSLAPYISERGVDAVMKNAKTRELLDDYILIDNPYKTKEYLTKIFGNT